MLDPVVLPLPLALAVIAAVAVAAYAYRRWLEAAPDWRPRPGRHRLAEVAEPYRPRDWASVTAERLCRKYETLELAARLEVVHERTVDAMWSWSDEADTRELAAVR